MAKNRKILLTVLSVALIAIIGIFGTIAYLTDTDSQANVMTMGKVDIEQHEYQRVQNADGTYATDTIDGKTSYVLEEFEQCKGIVPIVGDPSTGAAGWDPTTVRMSQVDSYGGMQVFAGKNAQDKFVTVENTGKSDAYVRTIVAIEAGSTDGSLIGVSYHSTWTKNEIGIVNINGNNYTVVEYLYAGGQLSDGSWRHENGILPAADTTYPNLSQVYIKSAATNDDIEAIDGNDNGALDILVLSQAVQADGFDNAEKALEAAFGAVNAANVKEWFGAVEVPGIVNVADDAAFEAALQDTTADKIYVSLENDVTYDVAAWDTDAMGGEATEEIVIIGNGHTITFNQTNSDWNNIVTNGATLVIRDAKITNSGYNNGPWNRHDLNFGCDVVLEDVISDKAMAFKAGATLTNVTINDANTSDTYAIWIQPNGQTVTLNGCTIDMLACTDGRGIKIDEQYVDAPAKVTLNVSDTVFKTEEKSAILVKSVAGADINLSNVNIAAVAADSTNAVWVDEASTAYADLVNVIGGTKRLEP